ncbi:metallophosphoesterase family protein [Methylobacterium goesingense]|uniref:MPP superfamily phosphohydrolase n=1 Tax=Methylobacterium goesingense TaxID=243690 RepID=A0ABV2LAF7_9HYPH|nr:metallophosphoesterase [Methylobacterium goesingense]
MIRNTSLVSHKDVFIMIFVFAFFQILRYLLTETRKDLFISASLVVGQLVELLVLSYDAILNLNASYVSVHYSLYSYSNPPDGWWIVVYYASLVLSILSIPFIFYNIYILLRLSFRPAQRIISAFRTGAIVASPYALRWKRVYSKNIVEKNKDVNPEFQDGQRILLISDLHISETGSAPMLSERSSDDALSNLKIVIARSSLDAVVFVGDMTDTGSNRAWEKLTEISNSLTCPVLAVPGNHDVHFASFNTIDGGYDLFSKQSYDSRYVSVKIRELTSSYQEGGYPFVKRLGTSPVVIILLDSNRRPCSGPATNALGYVGRDQLTAAEVKLRKIAKPSDNVIVILHHPVVYGEGNWFLQCMDGNRVLDFAIGVGASAIVYGHLHAPWVGTYQNAAGSIIIISCGSFHHPAKGPCAKDVKSPSAYILTIGGSAIGAKIIT